MKISKYLPILLCLYCLNALAWGWGKYEAYECPNQESAQECSALCKKENMQLEFKVNREKNFVMILMYEGGKGAGSSTFDNCKIIDTDNWSCERDSRISMMRMAMKNGVYDRTMHDLTGRLVNFYSCAKR